MEQCDTLFMIGTSFPYIEYLPKPGPGQGGADRCSIPNALRSVIPLKSGWWATVVVCWNTCFPCSRRKEDRNFLEKAQEGMKDWWELMEKRATRMDKPMKPQVVAWELGKRLHEDAIVSCDSGTIATWWARQIPVKRGQMHSVSGNSGHHGARICLIHWRRKSPFLNVNAWPSSATAAFPC